MDREPTIKHNKAECLKCGEIIESFYRHDFKYCKCGNIMVDGGKDYIRHGWTEKEFYKNLSESE